MRPITRALNPPAELAANFDTLTAEWLRRVAAAVPGSPAVWTWGPHADGKTVRDHILPKLMKQTEHHCSYCDLFPVTAGSPDTVDHFRPKGRKRWPELAYEWTNLFYACSGCQSEKLEHFDERVLKPDADDFRWQDYFRFNAVTGFLVPRLGIGTAERLRARATIKLFGLNRRGRPKARLHAYRDWLKLGKPAVLRRPYRFCMVPPPNE